LRLNHIPYFIPLGIIKTFFNSPTSPGDKDWSVYYDFNNANNSFESNDIKFADIGCGYGGLLIQLSEMYPNKLSLGMEIRVKVSDYVQDRIKALRIQHPDKYNNIACIRSNAMKYLPNFFKKGQVGLFIIATVLKKSLIYFYSFNSLRKCSFCIRIHTLKSPNTNGA